MELLKRILLVDDDWSEVLRIRDYIRDNTMWAFSGQFQLGEKSSSVVFSRFSSSFTTFHISTRLCEWRISAVLRNRCLWREEAVV